jgi:threonine synthase
MFRDEATIKFRSTNMSSDVVDFAEALFKGQPPDRGLYMPCDDKGRLKIPTIPLEVISSMEKMSYADIAAIVAGGFLENEIPLSDLRRIAKKAYDFVMPVREVCNGRYVMFQDTGPTLSFKDSGAKGLAGVMEYEVKKGYVDRATVLTSTSGDTGSAVKWAFHGLKGIDCIVVFPQDEITPSQRKLITTLGMSFAVKGTFDDCQALVKRAMADPDLGYLNLTSANSINFFRIPWQTAHSFYAYSRIAKEEGAEFDLSFPCGNLGHLTSGIIAKREGLPVHKFIAATNANNEFPEFMRTGTYRPIVPSINCISNAMNVGNPSNLARIVELYGGKMDEKGNIIRRPNLDLMRKEIYSVSASDEDTERTMREVYKKYYKLILEPHGAVAWYGLDRYGEETGNWKPSVLFETASPSKFPEQIERVLGVRPEIPEVLRKLEGKEEHFDVIPNNYGAFKKALVGLLKK